ncbi:MAG: hypothetical protein UX35_C0006G0074 [Microgenomates group bacterium GW2011_GWA1_46_15]|nr:MAG: hypothetical protein UX00_C0007G0074 [Microgenomates group bacterium GW2011_GWB1_45_17]KKU23398.1 MAG: hypothetical protein UX35_C0006G0074 [Microgenomates group bacterium GW2011_GWA1_46_15]KKU24472.1 MAG: hypothetical protein UX36_C0001G0089 [Microgenomates group bacterium GW2011_GWC1_46_15]
MPETDEQFAASIKESVGESRQTVVGMAINARNARDIAVMYMKEGNAEKEKEWKEEKEKLERWLKIHIRKYGGVQAIDDWLKEHDPGHALLMTIPNMDWSFLEKAS